MSESSASTSPSALTPESTGSTGLASPDTSVSSSGPAIKKSRRQTAFYPNMNSSNKTQKPFSRSAAKRESVMALGSIEHLQWHFTKAGIKSKKKPLDKMHHGLVPAIGTNLHSPGNSSITSISDLQLPPTPIIPNPNPEPAFAPHVKSTEIDPETLLPGVVEDLSAVSRAWCIDLDPSAYSDESPIDVLDVLQTTTRAIRSTRNYLLSQPDESAGIIREHFRSNRLGPQASSRGGAGDKSNSVPDPLTLIRRSALEVLAVLRELEEKTRLPLSDDAYDAQSDGGGSGSGFKQVGRVASPNHDDEDIDAGTGIHQVDKDTAVAFSLMQVNGRYESVPVWEDLDADTFSVEEEEKKDRWDERLVLGSGWLYQQDVTLAQLTNERKLVGQYLDVVDEVLFEGKTGGRGEQRGWEREKRRIRDKERSRSSAKRRVSAGDVESRSVTRTGIALGSGSTSAERRRISTGMLPDLMGRVNISEEPQQMEGISEEAENEGEVEADEDTDDEGGLEDDVLPEWAKRLAFMDSDLDRAQSLLRSMLPAHLQPVLPTEPPSSSDASRTAFLESLSSGQLLCVAYNTGVRKSKQPWGYINKEGIHDILALQKAEAEKANGESKKTGWTFRRSDNLRLWVGALKLRYMLPILVPSQMLSTPQGGGSGTPSASNTPLSSPLPLLKKFPSNEPPIMFDARIVAKQGEGWEEMLEVVVKRWMWRVVDEKRMEK
ncbi:hypothetical protein BT96DRAFT_862321 [Gymnopus androsaceus JB14]|uniref:Uncharacterized protein n=1 Tax=Gymnopus androsaceus JB14 TaxID=1447944 RepID=A0A6A4HAZ4_9AGAR|nr:hypothetical protein BT96DRAFT_862321 [Gymnopus androsaceus JB14]